MTQARILTPEPEVSPSELVAKHSTELIKFDVTEQQIARMGEEFAGITFDNPKNYEAGTKALRTLRELRVGVKETHHTLKAESLAFGRRVDAAAKHYTALLEEIEAPLLAAKSAVDTEKLRLKAEKEAAEKAAVEAQIRAEREAEEARLKAIRDAEQADIDRQKAELGAELLKLDAERREAAERERVATEARQAVERAERERVAKEQAAERERMAAERRKLEDEQKAERDRAAAERQKLDEERRAVEREKDRVAREGIRQAAEEAAKLNAEREAIETERRAVAAEKERLDRLEFERQAAITAEANARAKAEEERVAAEEARIAQAEREAAALARLEALRPDREKLRMFARQIRSLLESAAGVAFSTPEATDAFVGATEQLDDTAVYLEQFGSGESN
jgi:hypothetical protein